MQESVAGITDHLIRGKIINHVSVFIASRSNLYLSYKSFFFFYSEQCHDVNINFQHTHFDTFFLPKKKVLIRSRWRVWHNIFNRLKAAVHLKLNIDQHLKLQTIFSFCVLQSTVFRDFQFMRTSILATVRYI